MGAMILFHKGTPSGERRTAMWGLVLVGHRGGSFPFAWGVDRLSVIRFEIVHMYVCLPVYVANICEYE